MKAGFWGRVAICLGILGVLAYFQPLLAGAAVVAGIAIAAAATMRRTKVASEGSPTEGLSLDAEARIRPLLQARRRIAEVAERNAGHPVIKVVGGEAVQEADDVIAKAAGLLRSRTELNRAGSLDDTARIERLRAMLEATNDLAEKDRLASAIELATSAQGHHEKRAEALARIDSQLEEARAALEEMHAELSASLTEHTGAADDLRETLGRLKSLGTSLDEAQDLLQERR